MGPGAPPVGAVGLLMMILLALFFLFVPLYWNSFVVTRLAARMSALWRHFAGALVGLAAGSLSVASSLAWLVYAPRWTGILSVLLVPLIAFSVGAYTIRRKL